MKILISIGLTLLLISSIAYTSKAQAPTENRFTKIFQSADSAFNESVELKLFESIDLEIDNPGTQAKITIKVRDYLQMYWVGYLNGSQYSLKKGSIDLDSLNSDLIANRKAIESYLRFIKMNH